MLFEEKKIRANYILWVQICCKWKNLGPKLFRYFFSSIFQDSNPDKEEVHRLLWQKDKFVYFCVNVQLFLYKHWVISFIIFIIFQLRNFTSNEQDCLQQWWEALAGLIYVILFWGRHKLNNIHIEQGSSTFFFDAPFRFLFSIWYTTFPHTQSCKC